MRAGPGFLFPRHVLLLSVCSKEVGGNEEHCNEAGRSLLLLRSRFTFRIGNVLDHDKSTWLVEA